MALYSQCTQWPLRTHTMSLNMASRSPWRLSFSTSVERTGGSIARCRCVQKAQSPPRPLHSRGEARWCPLTSDNISLILREVETDHTL